MILACENLNVIVYNRTVVVITVEPHVSDHPKCEDLLVAYENRIAGGFFREEVRTHLL